MSNKKKDSWSPPCATTFVTDNSKPDDGKSCDFMIPQTPRKVTKVQSIRSPSTATPSSPSRMGPKRPRRNSDAPASASVSDLNLDATISCILPQSESPLLKRPPVKPSLSRPVFTEQQNKALSAMWRSCPVSAIVSKQHAVTIPAMYTLIQAFEVLATHGIMSAPIWDTVNHRIVGMLDYRDLCALVIRVLTRTVPASPSYADVEAADAASRPPSRPASRAGAGSRPSSPLLRDMRRAPLRATLSGPDGSSTFVTTMSTPTAPASTTPLISGEEPSSLTAFSVSPSLLPLSASSSASTLAPIFASTSSATSLTSIAAAKLTAHPHAALRRPSSAALHPPSTLPSSSTIPSSSSSASSSSAALPSSSAATPTSSAATLTAPATPSTANTNTSTTSNPNTAAATGSATAAPTTVSAASSYLSPPNTDLDGAASINVSLSTPLPSASSTATNTPLPSTSACTATPLASPTPTPTPAATAPSSIGPSTLPSTPLYTPISSSAVFTAPSPPIARTAVLYSRIAPSSASSTASSPAHHPGYAEPLSVVARPLPSTSSSGTTPYISAAVHTHTLSSSVNPPSNNANINTSGSAGTGTGTGMSLPSLSSGPPSSLSSSSLSSSSSATAASLSSLPSATTSTLSSSAEFATVVPLLRSSSSMRGIGSVHPSPRHPSAILSAQSNAALSRTNTLTASPSLTTTSSTHLASTAFTPLSSLVPLSSSLPRTASNTSLAAPQHTQFAPLSPPFSRVSSLSAVLRYAPAGQATDYSHRDSFYSVLQSQTLLSVVHLFKERLHRVCVLDEQREFVGVVSQSDALRHAYSHVDDIAFVADKTLLELGLVRARPLCASQQARVIEALVLMQDNAVSSLALVDGSGCLVANLSMTDIKYLFRQGNLSLLFRSCQEFMGDVRRAKDQESHYETKMPVFYCSPQSTLRRVMGQLCATRTHRIWVVDEATKPIAIVTLTDIMRILAPDEDSDASATLASHGIPPMNFVPAEISQPPQQ